MPKRSAQDKIEYYSAKIKKLKSRKCNSFYRRRILYSSSDSEDNVDGAQDYNGESRLASSRPSPPASPALALSAEPECEQQRASPSSDLPPAEPAPDVDTHDAAILPEFLDALGEPTDEAPVYGPDIHNTLAQRWTPILKKGIQQETKDKLLKLYSFPNNCRLLKAPSVNAEIFSTMAEISRNRDKKMQAKQDQLGLGITAINKAMTLLVTNEDRVQAVKVLSDSCRILSDLHFTETQLRRKLITPGLDKAFMSLIDGQDRDETIFGTNLSEKIKASKAIERQGLQIKKVTPKLQVPTTSTSNTTTRVNQGNWQGPPRYPSSSRGGRVSTYKPLTSSQYRRNQSSTAAPSRVSTSAIHKRARTRR